MARCKKYHYGILEEDEHLVAALYEDGFSAKEVGEKFGVNYRTVLKSLRRMGIQQRPVGGSKKKSESTNRR